MESWPREGVISEQKEGLVDTTLEVEIRTVSYIYSQYTNLKVLCSEIVPQRSVLVIRVYLYDGLRSGTVSYNTTEPGAVPSLLRSQPRLDGTA